MGTVNVCIYQKGGVGKSLVANLIAQAFIAGGVKPLCLEAELFCRTFSDTLPHWVVLVGPKKASLCNRRHFDHEVQCQLLEHLCTHPQVVLDVGPSYYFALDGWLFSPRILALLKEHGQRLVVHHIIKGGSELVYSIQGLRRLAQRYSDEPFDITLWLNQYSTEVGMEDVPQELWKYMSSQIDMSISKGEVPTKTLMLMMERQQTFDEALLDPRYRILEKSYLKSLRSQYAEAFLGRPIRKASQTESDPASLGT